VIPSDTQRPRRRVLLRRLVLDISPLRESRDFRLLWTGQAISVIGTQLTRVAVPYQVYDLTGSSLMVGLVSLAQLGPLLVCSLLGGSVADAVDRRKLMLVVQSILAVITAGLAVTALAEDPPLWPLFVLTALSAALSAIDSPARSASVASLVRREKLTAAFALNQSLNQVGQIVGPAIAGVVIAVAGLSVAYWIDVATFVASVLVVSRLRSLPPGKDAARPGLKSVAEGFRFLRGKKALQGCFLADTNAMVFGLPRALFPALGTGLFGGGPAVVGLLYAAPGVGALVGALTAGWVSSVRHQGRAVVLAIITWGLAIAAFGLTSYLPLALALLAVAGAADVISAVFRQTILQLSVPEHLRGRMTSIHIGVVTGGPLTGDARAGAVASATTPEFSVVSGGLVCAITMVAIAGKLPALRRWTLDDAVAEGGDSKGR
jgi:MFS family permease